MYLISLLFVWGVEGVMAPFNRKLTIHKFTLGILLLHCSLSCIISIMISMSRYFVLCLADPSVTNETENGRQELKASKRNQIGGLEQQTILYLMLNASSMNNIFILTYYSIKWCNGVRPGLAAMQDQIHKNNKLHQASMLVFNCKTQAAVFPCKLCFLRAFRFMSLTYSNINDNDFNCYVVTLKIN